MLKTDFQHYLFPRLSKPKANGNVPIYFRIQSKTSRVDISTGVDCKANAWNKKFKRISDAPDAGEKNEILEVWEGKSKQAIKALCEEEEYFSPEDVRDYIHGKRKVTGLIELFEIRKEELKSDPEYSPNTIKVYNSTYVHLKNFLKKKHCRSEYGLKRVEYTFISNFSIYLKSTCGCNTNSANKYLKTLKAVLNEARKQKLISHSPFENYQIKAGQYNRTFLTEQELQKIIQCEIDDPKLDIVRDFFLFVCYTGLNYSDVKSMTSENILERQGAKWIRKRRIKNGEEALIPLLKSAEAIIYKHKSLPKTANELLKLYSNQKTNQHLKALAQKCEINANLTCRVGRHTFATTVTLTNQVPLESVSKMLGHTSVKTTQIYARVTASRHECC